MTTGEVRDALLSFDLDVDTVRALNQRLHDADAVGRVRIAHPGGRHAIAVGLDAPYEVEIDGHVGYYCAGMNQQATVRVRGNCGVGVAENMMSGTVVVRGARANRPAPPPAAGRSSSTATRRPAAGSRSRAPTSSSAARSGT